MLAGFELCFLLKHCCPPPALLFSIVKIMLLLRNLFILIHSFLFFRRSWWNSTPVLLPRKSHGRRSLVGCTPWGRKESDTTEPLHFHFSLSCIGEGNGNPLQCSCLENPRDGRAWWAAVYGVTQSRTRLKWLSSSSSSSSSGYINMCSPFKKSCILLICNIFLISLTRVVSTLLTFIWTSFCFW